MWLSVTDGTTSIGVILDTRRYVRGRRSPPAPSFAFDHDGHALGAFPDRRTAMRAVGARFDFEIGRAAA